MNGWAGCISMPAPMPDHETIRNFIYCRRVDHYLIPMAISLGFGIIFSTAIVLVLVPCLYMAMEDIVLLLKSVWT